MGKKAASQDDIAAFMAAVFPDAPALARAAFDERHVLQTATSELNRLRAALTEAEQERDALRQRAGEIWDTPQQWMKWCDLKVLERAEAAEAREKDMQRAVTQSARAVRSAEKKMLAAEARERQAFEAGYHCTWSPELGYRFDRNLKPGDVEGAFTRYLAQREREMRIDQVTKVE